MSYDEKPWLKSYGPGVQKEIDPPQETFVTHFNAIVQQVSQAPALHFLGKTLSYAQLAECADRFAQALISRGLKKGDVVELKGSDKYVNLITSKRHSYFEILRSKLDWGGSKNVLR